MFRTSLRSACSTVILLCSLTGSAAFAGVITAHGAVTALTNTTQLGSVIGTADFEGFANASIIPLNAYSAQGMLFHHDPLSTVLPGVTTGGSDPGPNAFASSNCNYFPAPAGGGSASGNCSYFGGVATFTSTVTQVGMTISRNGTQYLTAWDSSGNMLGQVDWTPSNDSTFFGIDTGGVAIGLLTLGNHDLWAGAVFGIGGATIISDNWVWAQAPEPGSLALVVLAAGLAFRRRRG